MTDRPYAFVYMMASRKNGTLYIGVTRDLGARVAEHKAKEKPQSFTARYNVTRLAVSYTHLTLPTIYSV